MRVRPFALLLFVTAAAGLLGAGSWAVGKEPVEAPAPKRDEVHQTIFFAVLEGLYRDGATNDFVDHVLAKDEETGHYRHFVPGCPICHPALDAFHVYRSRPQFLGVKDSADAFGHGVPAAWKKKLAGATQQERLDGLMALVRHYTKQRLERQRLTQDEKEWWTQSLRERAKKGTAILRELQKSGQAGAFQGAKFCGACEGASNWWE